MSKPLVQSGTPQSLFPSYIMQMAELSANQAADLAVFLHTLPREGLLSAELQPAASVFVLCPGCELRIARRADRTAGLNNNALFLLFYRWIYIVYSREIAGGGFDGQDSMNSQCYTVAMDLGVCQLRNFSISFLSSVLGRESASVRVDNR